MPEQKGISKSSGKEWMSQEFVVRNDSERFPTSAVFKTFNMPVNANTGDEVIVSFDPEAREYNGRWFVNLRAYKIERVQEFAQAPRMGQTPPPPPPPQQEFPPQQKDDDLPF